MTRARARANATRDVSIVIQRRPIPPRRSRRTRTTGWIEDKSPGSVAIKTHRSTTSVVGLNDVHYGLESMTLSTHTLASGAEKKSSMYRIYAECPFRS